MSQLGRKAGPDPPGPAPHSPGPGTFDYVAGFRIGRGRDNRASQSRPHGQRAPQGQAPYGYSPAPPNGQPQQHQYGGQRQPRQPQQPYGQQQWPQPGGQGEPEYFGDPRGPQGQGQGQGRGQGPGQNSGYDPYAANNPGHTQAFSIGDDQYTQGDMYRAGSAPAAPVGPRLHWKDLLSGVVVRPGQTYLQMRDHAMWAPALIVTFLYGLLAIFGFDSARADVINATFSSAIPYTLTTAVAITISFFVLGVVTHTLARQLGGDGAWQPTVGLAMLITAITDAPRLLFAMFLGGDAPFVQIIGWATWAVAGFLLTVMVSKSHDLPWPKALAASAIQLIALLSIIKLGTF
ncbi:YIP1 family protein [Streptomyces antnestii]|uniref:YIP1 family protein n=1 Tax=Streptomyces antnestii TaxID=2494256 RepID=A0A3S2XX37_9ACTN|nr:Yip1 family protein [Streptomyces sp. San01]RVU27410.1 YIP1 family protein [Streptomyces sp. San01]